MLFGELCGGVGYEDVEGVLDGEGVGEGGGGEEGKPG